MKTAVILSLVSLTGCVPFWRQWMRPEKPKSSVNAIKPHESWCYRTLSEIECYPGPQRLPPESLVSVDPPSRFPLTREEHAKAVAQAQKARP